MGDVFHPSQPLPPSGSSSLQPLLLLILKHGPLESSGVCGLDTAPLPRRAELENPPTAPHLDLAAVPTNPGVLTPAGLRRGGAPLQGTHVIIHAGLRRTTKGWSSFERRPRARGSRVQGTSFLQVLPRTRNQTVPVPSTGQTRNDP